jgi:hypothetical protein
LKGIIFGKNIPIGCRDYPTYKVKEFRVFMASTDLSHFFSCREKPSKKTLTKDQA